jgi:hypothetical protein
MRDAYAAARGLIRGYQTAPSWARVQILRALQPRAGDYRRIFAEPAAAAAEACYAGLWTRRPMWPVRSRQTVLRLVAVRADELRVRAPLDPLFPDAYRLVAPALCRGPLWVCWELAAPDGGAHARFEGLVWLGDRLVWCPRPWKVAVSCPPGRDQFGTWLLGGVTLGSPPGESHEQRTTAPS